MKHERKRWLSQVRSMGNMALSTRLLLDPFDGRWQRAEKQPYPFCLSSVAVSTHEFLWPWRIKHLIQIFPSFHITAETLLLATLVSRPRHSWSHLKGTGKFLWYYKRVLLHKLAICLSRILATVWHFVLRFQYKLIHPMLVDLNSCIVFA